MKQLLVVTGKGGVGKSTVAAALGMAAARRGLRTIVAEVAARDDVTRVLGAGGAGRFREDELVPGLHHISIDPQNALEEYLRDQLPRRLADLLAHSRMFVVLAAATPGMRELLSVGKVWELTQPARRTPGAEPYDLVILDAPATGHGMALLEAPRTFSEVARLGKVARQGRTIHTMLSDPARTGVIAVATPEEMPVNETILLRGALRERMGLDLSRVVVNALAPARFSTAEAAALEGSLPPVRAARWAHRRGRAQRAQLQRLRRGLPGVPCVTLPQLYAGELDLGAIERLSRILERGL